MFFLKKHHLYGNRLNENSCFNKDNNFFQYFDPFDILKFETSSKIQKNDIRDFVVELKVQFMRRH